MHIHVCMFMTTFCVTILSLYYSRGFADPIILITKGSPMISYNRSENGVTDLIIIFAAIVELIGFI